jgi:hypothetical protein
MLPDSFTSLGDVLIKLSLQQLLKFSTLILCERLRRQKTKALPISLYHPVLG